MLQTKLTDFHSPEKEEIGKVLYDIPMMDKWIASLVENMIYVDVKEYYPEKEGGSLRIQYTTKYGERHGECKEFYNNGQLSHQKMYVDDKLTGEYKAWHSVKDESGVCGQIRLQAFLVNGEIHGESTSWYPNGQLHTQATYINGKMNGEYKAWYDNGQLRAISYVTNGKDNGEYKSWYRGTDNSNSVCGQPRVHTTYIDNKPHGEYKKWNEEGVLIEDKIYIDGVEVVD